MCELGSERECRQGNREVSEERRDEMESVGEKEGREEGSEKRKSPIEHLGDTLSYLTGRKRDRKGPRLEERSEEAEEEKKEGGSGDEERKEERQ